MKTIIMSTIQERIASLGELGEQYFFDFIDLILLVESNYYHIDQLDKLAKLFEKPSSDYHKEYQKGIVEANKLAKEITQITQAAHYRDAHKESEYYLMNVIALFPKRFSYSLERQEALTEGKDLYYKSRY